MLDGNTKSGALVLVPTPIGNLGDMTLRAIEELKSADVIYAEDTRVTSRLLKALGIKRRKGTLLRLDENTMGEHVDYVACKVDSGMNVAYCSDAGMPGVSDPGRRLVAAMRDRGLEVEVLPGASAAATAYVSSASPCPRFYFGGFLPRRKGERIEELKGLLGLDAALIFYESPRRVADTLKAIAEVFPQRRVSVCRELTKLHEETVQGISVELSAEFSRRDENRPIRGEIAIVVDAPTESERKAAHGQDLVRATAHAARLAGHGRTQKSMTGELVEKFGISKNEAYDIALKARAEHAS